MKIEIILTRDDGTTVTLLTNEHMSTDESGRTVWRLPRSKHASNLRALTSNENWAASFLCQMGMRVFLIDSTNRVAVAMAAAMNACDDANDAASVLRGIRSHLGAMMPRKTTDANASGTVSTSVDGDLAFSDND